MTTQTVELDPETGLALLPEGYIWRVASSSRDLELTLLRVDTETNYRTKWLFFGAEEYTETVETFVMSEQFDVTTLMPQARTKENISRGLSKLSENMYREWRRQQDQWELMRSFRGDYPPKNLNSV